MVFQRRKEIESLIMSQKSVRIQQLSEMFPDVSLMTLRRDLAALEQAGQIIRVRGGARAINTLEGNPSEPLYSQRQHSEINEKSVIAAHALPLLEEKRSIFLDSGTTLMSLCSQLPDSDWNLCTAAPNIAIEVLSHTTKAQITLLGGFVARNTISCSGRFALEQLRGINIDIAVMATSGFSLNSGFTSGNAYESELKAEVIRKARKVVMLLTGSKINRDLPYTFAQMSDIDVLICERALGEEIEQAAKENGVFLLSAT